MEEQYMEAIIHHMHDIDLLLPGHLSNYESIQDYIRTGHMDQNMTWGTKVEIFTMAYLLQTPIHMERAKWERHSPHILDKTLDDNHAQMSMYLRHPPAHFDVFHSIL